MPIMYCKRYQYTRQCHSKRISILNQIVILLIFLNFHHSGLIHNTNRTINDTIYKSLRDYYYNPNLTEYQDILDLITEVYSISNLQNAYKVKVAVRYILQEHFSINVDLMIGLVLLIRMIIFIFMIILKYQELIERR